ncbi:MAG: amino acid carrier protein, partial [Pseudomonadota bacterium]
NEYPDGTVSGGPMYYLSKGLAEKGMAGLGKFLAVFFAICCIAGSLGGGNMFQANQSFQQVVGITGGADGFMADKGWLFGLIVAAIVGFVIIGGIKSIARVTEKVVPFMALIYCTAALVIILVNFTAIPAAISAIVVGAFSPEGVAGGAIGALIQGFRRAAFSNEAGVGSASIAHSAVRTKEPITEGLVALHEPFIDTVVICTMTALVIVITGAYTAGGGMGGVELTSSAFESVLPWFPYILTIAVVLFAFSTMLSWSYYGAKCWTYLFGESRSMDLLFKVIFCIFIVIGSSMSLGPVVDLSDSAIFAMSVANIIGLYILFPVVKEDLASYWSRLKSGEIKRYRTTWMIHVD